MRLTMEANQGGRKTEERGRERERRMTEEQGEMVPSFFHSALID
jgi:hypothetical protein